jgi:hypothetical protein
MTEVWLAKNKTPRNMPVYAYSNKIEWNHELPLSMSRSVDLDQCANFSSGFIRSRSPVADLWPPDELKSAVPAALPAFINSAF